MHDVDDFSFMHLVIKTYIYRKGIDSFSIEVSRNEPPQFRAGRCVLCIRSEGKKANHDRAFCGFGKSLQRPHSALFACECEKLPQPTMAASNVLISSRFAIEFPGLTGDNRGKSS